MCCWNKKGTHDVRQVLAPINSGKAEAGMQKLTFPITGQAMAAVNASTDAWAFMARCLVFLAAFFACFALLSSAVASLSI